MNTKLVLDTLAQCVESVDFIIKDGANLTTPQTQLLETLNQSLQLVLAHIYITNK